MIHPTAIVDPGARLDADVEVGPYTVIGPGVEIGSGTRVGPHCVVTGLTTIGRDNRIFQFCSIGEMPQDKKYAGEPTRLEIGSRNTIREFCTINTGTAQDVGVTRLGDDNWIMAYVHVAHDCQVGSHAVLANGVTFGGHVEVGDWAVIGGLSAVHQFVHVGAHCMIGGGSMVTQDVPPYVTGHGDRCEPRGINSEGMRRRGYSPDAIAAVKRAYKTLYRSGLTLEDARREIERAAETRQELVMLAEFLARATRGIIR